LGCIQIGKFTGAAQQWPRSGSPATEFGVLEKRSHYPAGGTNWGRMVREEMSN